MTAALEASSITKRFGKHTVLAARDLHIDPGETVVLLGPNGAGKSTLIGCICGAVVPDEGRVVIGGHDLAREPVAARRCLRYLPQEVDVAEGLTGREYLQFMADVFGAPEQASRLAERSGLGEALDRLVTTFSVGMRRRLSFAALFAGLPAGATTLLVLDEPFAGVDHDGRAAMVRALQGALGSGCGLLVAAHDRDLDDLADMPYRTLELLPTEAGPAARAGDQ